VQGSIAGAEDRRQLFVHDLDDLLAGVEALEHVGTDRPRPHAGDELLDHPEIDVSLEQGQPHLAHGGIDVGLADPAAATQAGECVAQAVGKLVEHGWRV
jgi:hypothetical protein